MKEVPFAMANPDLQIREGPGHPDPEIMGRGGGGGGKRGAYLQKKFFRPFGPQFGLTIKWGRAPRPLPSPGSATAFVNRRYMKGVPSLPKMVFKKVS